MSRSVEYPLKKKKPFSKMIGCTLHIAAHDTQKESRAFVALEHYVAKCLRSGFTLVYWQRFCRCSPRFSVRASLLQLIAAFDMQLFW